MWNMSDYYRGLREMSQEAREWYESLIGKYIVIDFNGKSYCFVKITKSILDENSRFVAYDFYIDKDNEDYRIQKETRELNYLWFKNPYWNLHIYNYSGENIKEIDKEQYDRVVKRFEEISKEYMIPIKKFVDDEEEI